LAEAKLSATTPMSGQLSPNEPIRRFIMKRTLNHTSIPLPAIKLILTKEPKNGTAVHIGWNNEDGKAFCLCGHEVGVANTNGRWEEVSINTHPEITCGRCKRIWNSNRVRNVDTASPRWFVMNRIERDHLKKEYFYGNTIYTSDPAQHAYDEEHLNIKYGPHRFDRQTPCGSILIGIVEHEYKSSRYGLVLTDKKPVVHLASKLPNGLAVPMCNGIYTGGTVANNREGYEDYPYITCPHCIKYIKDNGLDASADEMEKRRIELAERQSRIDRLIGELDEEKKLFNALAVRTIVEY
jgi:hypothetical protein